MSLTTSTPEEFIESFPHPTLPKVSGQPTYATISSIKKLVAANAASVSCNNGGGLHGYLGIVLSPAVYATIAAAPFIAPVYPGPHPAVAFGATAAQITAATTMHKEQLREWREHTSMQNALKKQVLEAVDPIYLRALRNRHTGYANHTIREILTHLIDAYGLITPIDLKKNNDLLNEPWDPSTPFEHLIDQVEEAVEYADDGNQPFTVEQIINAAYTLVFNTGVFFEECKQWRLLAPALKTWDRFKTHFTEAHQQHRLQQATMQSSGYHKANYMSGHNMHYEETAAALANLATATAADRQAMANLTNTIETLTKQLATSQTEIQSLKQQLKQQRTRTRETGNYCWSHGFVVGPRHNSDTCRMPKDGHQRSATRENTMGGSTVGKPK
jgi:hypothetical protein